MQKRCIGDILNTSFDAFCCYTNLDLLFFKKIFLNTKQEQNFLKNLNVPISLKTNKSVLVYQLVVNKF